MPVPCLWHTCLWVQCRMNQQWCCRLYSALLESKLWPCVILTFWSLYTSFRALFVLTFLLFFSSVIAHVSWFPFCIIAVLNSNPSYIWWKYKSLIILQKSCDQSGGNVKLHVCICQLKSPVWDGNILNGRPIWFSCPLTMRLKCVHWPIIITGDFWSRNNLFMLWSGCEHPPEWPSICATRA